MHSPNGIVEVGSYDFPLLVLFFQSSIVVNDSCGATGITNHCRPLFVL